MVESLFLYELEPEPEPMKKNTRSRSKMDRLRNTAPGGDFRLDPDPLTTISGKMSTWCLCIRVEMKD